MAVEQGLSRYNHSDTEKKRLEVVQLPVIANKHTINCHFEKCYIATVAVNIALETAFSTDQITRNVLAA